ncbi:Fic/DOC family protein [Commensalibacter nepenthis]|uniref:protein adenylyltransferase n=1 Tax=Commensalibacter nepenthis TaxID=3043872 RepID=A0ABT6Q4C8_9PROT|nr:Fic family protein [Commensalibacter sp. TBRC 10068]MDI2111733.1 Fic family protein [Commensalibacter sp. TBRC 10068]
MDDPYIDKKTGLLKNNIQATTQKQLEAFELGWTDIRAQKLNERTVIHSNFDLNYAKELHKTLFQDVYPWAGEIRTVDIQKEDTLFYPNQKIEVAFDILSNEIKKQNYLQGSSPDKFAKSASLYMGLINAIHPFREGNGRTQRMFINDLAKVNGYKIEFDKVSSKDMREASIACLNKDFSPLSNLIKNNLVKLDKPLERIDPTQSLNKAQPTKQQSKTVKTLDKPKQEPDIER